jgi:hypothetical protein
MAYLRMWTHNNLLLTSSRGCVDVLLFARYIKWDEIAFTSSAVVEYPVRREVGHEIFQNPAAYHIILERFPNS